MKNNQPNTNGTLYLGASSSECSILCSGSSYALFVSGDGCFGVPAKEPDTSRFYLEKASATEYAAVLPACSGCT